MNIAHEAAINIGSSRELQAESVRLTAFLSPSVRVSEPTWWADLVGCQPDTRTSRPSRGELQEAGPLGDRTLLLSMQPGRVDWVLTPRQEEGVLPQTKWIGLFPESLEAFDPLMTSWLGNCPRLVRLAFGAIVAEPVPDRVAGYRKLAEYLPAVHLDPERSYDFLYQINRPRDSSIVETLKINRLCKWSVTRFVPFMLTIASHAIQPIPIRAEEYVCRIELDINTAAEFVGELPSQTLPQLFEELRRLAIEIATRGDIP